MGEIEVELKIEKETKNFYRYQEIQQPGRDAIVNTLYVKKWVFGNKAPDKIKVKISWE